MFFGFFISCPHSVPHLILTLSPCLSLDLSTPDRESLSLSACIFNSIYQNLCTIYFNVTEVVPNLLANEIGTGWVMNKEVLYEDIGSKLNANNLNDFIQTTIPIFQSSLALSAVLSYLGHAWRGGGG